MIRVYLRSSAVEMNFLGLGTARRARVALGYSNPTQVIEREKTGGMAITPEGLDGITPHGRDAYQVEGLGSQRFFRSLVQLPHDIDFTSTPRAGTRPTQGFKAEVTLGLILPFDGELIANDLQIHGSHMRRITLLPAAVHERVQGWA